MPAKPSFKSLATWIAGTAAALLFTTSAQATLVGRDLSGNAVANNSASAVFFYDTDRNITWLRNANAAAGSSFDNGASSSDGRMGWSNAMAWAADLTVGSFSDWRLPVGQAHATCGNFNFNCTASELGHLWYSELGNAVNAFNQVIGTVNKGDFQNFLTNPDSLWTSTEFDATHVFIFSIDGGSQDISLKESVPNFPAELRALAVRDGDVLRIVTPTQRRTRARHFAVDRSSFAWAGCGAAETQPQSSVSLTSCPAFSDSKTFKRPGAKRLTISTRLLGATSTTTATGSVAFCW